MNRFKQFIFTILIILATCWQAAAGVIQSPGVDGTNINVNDLTFQNEIKPDGVTCNNGQILKRTGANDWDCASDDSAALTPATNYYVAGHMSPSILYNTGPSLWAPQCKIDDDCLALDGTNDRVYLNPGTALRPGTLSVSFWVAPRSTSATDVVSKTQGSDGYRVLINGSTGVVQFITNGGANVLIASGTSCTTGVWCHVIVTADGSGHAIYINNVLANSNVTAYSSHTADYYLNVGARCTANCTTSTPTLSNFYAGKVDDVRIYPAVLTLGNRSTIYNSGMGSDCATDGTLPSLCWKLNDGTGTTATDSSGNGRNGTLENVNNNATTAWQNDFSFTSGWIQGFAGDGTCKIGSSCLVLDGSNDYGKSRNIASLDVYANWTLEAWIQLQNNTTTQSIIEKYDNVTGKGGFAMQISSAGKLVGATYNGISSNTCTGITTLTPFTWYLVAVKFNDLTDALTCLVNGVAENTNSTATLAGLSSSVPLIIGARGSDAGATYFYGKIQEVALWNTDLATTTILGHYSTPALLVGNEANLAAVWHANHGYGSVLTQPVAQTNSGSDSNNCTSSLTPCRTMQGAADKISEFYAGSSVIHVASGDLTDDVSVIGYNRAGDYTITLQGYINSTPNSFTDSPQYTGTSTGSNTSNFPADTRSLFLDTGKTFTASDVTFGLLEITGGTGYVSTVGEEYKNWYRIECPISAGVCAASGTALSVVAGWEDNATPDSTTTYRIYDDDNLTTINVGGYLGYQGPFTSTAGGAYDAVSSTNIPAYGISVQDSAGIILRKLAVERARVYDIYAINSHLSKIESVSVDDSSVRGMDIDSSVVDLITSVKGDNNIGASVRYIYGSAILTTTKNIHANSIKTIGLGLFFGGSSEKVLYNLSKGNTNQAGFGFESNSASSQFEYNRSDGNKYGVIIGESSRVETSYSAVMKSNEYGVYVQNGGIYSFGGTPSLTISNNTTGIYLKDGGLCLICDSATLTGNTTNTVLPAPSSLSAKEVVNYANYAYEYDDFLTGTNTSGNIGKGWLATAGTLSYITGLNTGAFRLQHTATASLYTPGTATMGLGDCTVLYVAKTGVVTSVGYRMGLGSSTSDPPADGVYFERLSTDTNWFAVTRASSVQTRTDTGIAASISAYHEFKFIKTGSTSVAFSIDGVLVATNTTNVPAVSMMSIATGITTAAVTDLLLDFWSYYVPTR